MEVLRANSQINATMDSRRRSNNNYGTINLLQKSSSQLKEMPQHVYASAQKLPMMADRKSR